MVQTGEKLFYYSSLALRYHPRTTSIMMDYLGMCPCKGCIVFVMCRGRAHEEQAAHTDIFYIGLAQECPELLKFIRGPKVTSNPYNSHRIHECKKLYEVGPVVDVIKYQDEQMKEVKEVFK